MEHIILPWESNLNCRVLKLAILIYELGKTFVIVNVFLYIERYHVYNNFTTNHGWLVIIGSNLNLALRLLF